MQRSSTKTRITTASMGAKATSKGTCTTTCQSKRPSGRAAPTKWTPAAVTYRTTWPSPIESSSAEGHRVRAGGRLRAGDHPAGGVGDRDLRARHRPLVGEQRGDPRRLEESDQAAPAVGIDRERCRCHHLGRRAHHQRAQDRAVDARERQAGPAAKRLVSPAAPAHAAVGGQQREGVEVLGEALRAREALAGLRGGRGASLSTIRSARWGPGAARAPRGKPAILP